MDAVKKDEDLLDIVKLWGLLNPILVQHGWKEWTISTDPLPDLTAQTDMGNVRTNNEDAHAALRFSRGPASQPVTVLLIADGVGGEELGEVASNLTVKTVAADMIRTVLALGSAPAAEHVANSLSVSHDLVRSEGGRRGIFDRMATTAVAAVLQGTTLHLAHAGDSRAYVLGGGRLKQVTRDHSLMSELIRLNRITREDAREIG